MKKELENGVEVSTKNRFTTLILECIVYMLENWDQDF